MFYGRCPSSRRRALTFTFTIHVLLEVHAEYDAGLFSCSFAPGRARRRPGRANRMDPFAFQPFGAAPCGQVTLRQRVGASWQLICSSEYRLAEAI